LKATNIAGRPCNKKDPTRPNLRQLHLVQSELIEELNATGFDVRPGDLGENITTGQIDLPALPQGTLLRLGHTAIVEITGLRTPCKSKDFGKGFGARLPSSAVDDGWYRIRPREVVSIGTANHLAALVS
jgi:MOSC domain-containing protein YiiM